MERISYAGGVLLTGDAIARAVISYAEALAKRGTAAEVDIPVRRDDGSLGAAQLLLGPASQLVAEAVETDLEDPVDDDLVARLRVKTAELSDSRPVFDDSAASADPDFELTAMIDGVNGTGGKGMQDTGTQANGAQDNDAHDNGTHIP